MACSSLTVACGPCVGKRRFRNRIDFPRQLKQFKLHSNQTPWKESSTVTRLPPGSYLQGAEQFCISNECHPESSFVPHSSRFLSAGAEAAVRSCQPGQGSNLTGVDFIHQSFAGFSHNSDLPLAIVRELLNESKEFT